MTAVKNPTPLHNNDNNFGIIHLVAYNINDNLLRSISGTRSHVSVIRFFMSVTILVDADKRGTSLHGNYAVFLTESPDPNKRLVITCYFSSSLVA